MNLLARSGLQVDIRHEYQNASWMGSGNLLDKFVVATDFDRKYAIHLLNSA